VPLERLLTMKPGDRKWEWLLCLTGPPTPIHVRATDTFKEPPPTKSKQSSVVFSAAESRFVPTWKSGSANGAELKQSAATSCMPLQKSNWETKIEAPEPGTSLVGLVGREI
jgi:hypothetical protein